MKEILQKLAFNCLDLALLVKQCHWNVRGAGFKPIHDFLDIVFEQLIDVADDVSERMVTLDIPAGELRAIIGPNGLHPDSRRR